MVHSSDLSREELYEQLHEELTSLAEKGLDEAKIQEYRTYFDCSDPNGIPREYPHHYLNSTDRIQLVCAPMPKEMAAICRRTGELLASILQPEDVKNWIHVNEEEAMHMTLFHTSHPKDLAPNALHRYEEQTQTLERFLKAYSPFEIIAKRVVITREGTILMLFDGVSDDEEQPYDLSCSVDLIRNEAPQYFPYFPKVQTRTIMHATIGQILSTNIMRTGLARAVKFCESISAKLQSDQITCCLDHVWYVQEEHYAAPHKDTKARIIIGDLAARIMQEM